MRGVLAADHLSKNSLNARLSNGWILPQWNQAAQTTTSLNNVVDLELTHTTKTPDHPLQTSCPYEHESTPPLQIDSKGSANTNQNEAADSCRLHIVWQSQYDHDYPVNELIKSKINDTVSLRILKPLGTGSRLLNRLHWLLTPVTTDNSSLHTLGWPQFPIAVSMTWLNVYSHLQSKEFSTVPPILELSTVPPIGVHGLWMIA